MKLNDIHAGITQLVEYLTRNEEVEGSSPFSSSKKWLYNAVFETLINHKFFEGLKSTGKSTGIVKKSK